MIYKPDIFNSTGNGETKFRNWLESVLRGQNWHVQIFEDRQRKGIPDISAAGRGVEAWLELKVAKRLHSVHDYLHLDHPVTAQQHRWLLDRKNAAPGVECGIVVAWRTGDGEGSHDARGGGNEVAQYVSYVPIGEWRGKINRYILMKWALSPFTSTMDWLGSGGATFLQVLRGELTPGWGGRSLSGLSPQRQH